MEDIVKDYSEYISPGLRIIRMSSPAGICAVSGGFGSDGTEIPGMKDNDW